MMNTRIHYLYRDADNYKVQNECVILGEMTGEQEQRIIACLDEEEYFVPSRVGMPERKFDTETDSDHPWFEWERIEETGQKPTLEITAEELVKRFEEASKGWESVRTAPESGKLPYCVTVQETLSRTVIVWAAERIDAEVTAQELCNAGDIELGSKDFVDRECTCDGVAEVGDFDTFEEYGGTQQPDLGLLLCQQLQQGIHVPLILEVALLLFAAVVLHHKVSHGGKHSLAGKAARTHGHPLEHAGDAGVGQVVAAVDVKAVQIQGFFAHAAGADLFAGFPISHQLGGIEPGKAQLCRFEEHNVHPSFAFLFVPIFPLRQRKCKAQPALLAKNRKPAAELTAAGLFY